MSPTSPLPQPRSPLVDVVVVGAGVLGAAAAWRLARRGANTVILDRFPAGHTHGASRIFRHADTSPRYLHLAAEALPLWRELEAETGAQLLTITGGVDHSDRATTSLIADVLAAHGVQHEWLEPSDAALRWPGMRFDGPVLYQPDRAGRIDTDHAGGGPHCSSSGSRCPDTQACDCDGGRGARRRPGARAHLDRSDRCTPRRGRRRRMDDAAARRRGRPAAVASDPGAPGALPFHDVPPCVARPGAWPIFLHHGPGVYGLADPCGDVKVGLKDTGVECDPDRRSVTAEPEGLARLQDYVTRSLPGLDASRPRPISCTSTSAPDGEFVLERHGPLVVGAGFPGHGFKHAPAVGEALAALATDRVPAEASPLAGDLIPN